MPYPIFNLNCKWLDYNIAKRQNIINRAPGR